MRKVQDWLQANLNYGSLKTRIILDYKAHIHDRSFTQTLQFLGQIILFKLYCSNNIVQIISGFQIFFYILFKIWHISYSSSSATPPPPLSSAGTGSQPPERHPHHKYTFQDKYQNSNKRYIMELTYLWDLANKYIWALKLIK